MLLFSGHDESRNWTINTAGAPLSGVRHQGKACPQGFLPSPLFLTERPGEEGYRSEAGN